MSCSVQEETLDQLETRWSELLPRASYPSVFASPAWLRVWQREFDEDQLLLLSVSCQEELVGVAPLMIDRGGRLSFAGDTQIFDYMDFVSQEGGELPLISAVFRSLLERPWRELVLWGIREDSPTLIALPQICDDLGLSLKTELEDICPRVDLPGTWDEYLEGLGKKDRHELRRKLRRLAQSGDVRLEVLDTPAEINSALGDFLRMHTASRSDKAAFFEGIASETARKNQAKLLFLTLDGVRVAGVLCFRIRNELLLYNSGYDPAYSGLAVGLLSKALALRHAIEEGLARFDFLRGAEPYKYDLGGQNFNVYRCIIHRP